MSPLSGGVGLRVLSICLGVFVFSMGYSKTAWFREPELLGNLLQEWLDAAPAYTRWYLESVAIPGVPIFARAIPVTEMLAGTALVIGAFPRFAAALVFLMVLNFHFSSDLIPHTDYLINPYGLPVLGGLLAVALTTARLPFSVRG